MSNQSASECQTWSVWGGWGVAIEGLSAEAIQNCPLVRTGRAGTGGWRREAGNSVLSGRGLGFLSSLCKRVFLEVCV